MDAVTVGDEWRLRISALPLLLSKLMGDLERGVQGVSSPLGSYGRCEGSEAERTKQKVKGMCVLHRVWDSVAE